MGVLSPTWGSTSATSCPFYQDRSRPKRSWPTPPTLRVINLAALIGYVPAPRCRPPEASIRPDPSTPTRSRCRRQQLVTASRPCDNVITFETDTAVTVPAARGHRPSPSTQARQGTLHPDRVDRKTRRPTPTGDRLRTVLRRRRPELRAAQLNPGCCDLAVSWSARTGRAGERDAHPVDAGPTDNSYAGVHHDAAWRPSP